MSNKSKKVKDISRVVEEMRNQERLETKYVLVVSLWEDGIHDLERIARLTKISLENVKEAYKNKKRVITTKTEITEEYQNTDFQQRVITVMNHC